MSFRTAPSRPLRRNRSELAVPATSPHFFKKAASSAADAIFLDLEDAVAPALKAAARREAIVALREIEWGEKLVSVRVNGLDTPLMYRDVIDILEQGGERVDLLMLPKIGCAADVYALDMLTTQVEMAVGRKRRIGFAIIIETAAGVEAASEIACASPRIESLHFGVGDYSLSIHANGTEIGGANRDYAVLANEDGARTRHLSDLWHYPMKRVLLAARRNGLRAIDGPFANFKDIEASVALARNAAAAGFDGKWAIHPSQIGPANEAFTPSQAAIARAQHIVDRLAAAETEGRGAISDDGRLLDIASRKQAEIVLERAALYGAMKAPSP